MQLKVQAELISGNVNQVFDGLEWKSKNYIFYGCNNQIFIYDLNQKKVRASLKGHSKKVQTIRQINSSTDGILLLSTSEDGSLIFWRNKSQIWEYQCWETVQKIELGYKLTKLELVQVNDQQHIVAVSSNNGNFYILRLTRDRLEVVQSLDFGKNVQENIGMWLVEEDRIVMVIGGLDKQVHIYEYDNKENRLEYVYGLKGHEDSVTDVKIQKINNSQVFVATSDKKGSIRIWRITDQLQQEQKNTFQVEIFEKQYMILLESILIGHVDMVSSLMWNNGQHTEYDMLLMSSGFDFSTFIWKKDKESGIWMNISQLGQMSGNKNAFFHSKFSPDNQYVIGYCYGGSCYLYKKVNESDYCQEYEQEFIFGGHFQEVTDIDWNSDQNYLVSCSYDQTSRIWGYWQSNDSWHEIARPQIHGYDINTIANLKISQPVYDTSIQLADLIVCGADEKIIRVFEPSALFVNQFNGMSQKSIHLYFGSKQEEDQYIVSKDGEVVQYNAQTEGGQQVLGLLTRQVKIEKEKYNNYYDQDEDQEVINMIQKQKKKDQNFYKPPSEDYLSKHTLWPELNKLYGHGFELKALITSHNGQYIASACKSQMQQHSAIFIWETKTFKVVQQLEGHHYSVTQIAFSRNDEYVGSVSRDRQLILWKLSGDKFMQIAKVQHHSKIIWSLDFLPFDKMVATGSRDKRVKIYDFSQKVELKIEKIYKFAVTAIAFSIGTSGNRCMMYTGLESGQIIIQICEFKSQQIISIESIHEIHDNIRPAKQINRIKVRKQDQQKEQIAVCSGDCSVRIYSIVEQK